MHAVTHANAFSRKGVGRGYELGCRSRGGCPRHRYPTSLSCVEGCDRCRGDSDLGSLPSDQPLPRRDVYYSYEPALLADEPCTSRGPRHGVAIPPGMHRRLAAAPLGGSAASRAPRLVERYFAELPRAAASSATAPRSGTGHPPATSAAVVRSRRVPETSWDVPVNEATCPSIGVSTHVRGAFNPPAPTVLADDAVRLVTELAETALDWKSNRAHHRRRVGPTIARLISARVDDGRDAPDYPRRHARRDPSGAAEVHAANTALHSNCRSQPKIEHDLRILVGRGRATSTV